MDAVLYTRVSRLTDGRSTQDQEKECRQWCEANDHDVEKVFTDDGISASRYGKTRDAWEELKEYLRPGHLLVAWSSSRTTRDLGEYVALRNLCASLKVPLAYSGRVLDLTQGDDRFVGGLDALIAERESETIKANILRGKRQSAAAGTPSGRAPWGYKRVAPKEWIPDPVEARRVAAAIRKMLDGESMGAAYRWLKKTGYAPASVSAFRDAILNPAYAGLRVHQGVVMEGVKGTWTPIITEDEHSQIVARVERGRALRRFQEIPGPEPRHLLSGIAKCSTCDQGLRYKFFKDRTDCYVCDKGHCARLAEPLDKYIEKRLFEKWSTVDPNEYDPSEDPEVKAAQDEIEELEESLQDWIAAAQKPLSKGGVTSAAFSEIERGIRNRIAVLRPRTVGKERSKRMSVEEVESRWKTGTLRQKRELIRGLFSITVHPLGGRGQPVEHNVIIEPL